MLFRSRGRMEEKRREGWMEERGMVEEEEKGDRVLCRMDGENRTVNSDWLRQLG